VKYQRRYGSAAAVAEGSANAVGDARLGDKLELERKGILAWMVRGAVEWYKQGLNPPESVIEAGREYQNEQDRMASFVEERCVYDPDAWTSNETLHDSYTVWARRSGFVALSKFKFMSELERVMGPRFSRAKRREGGNEAARGVRGIRLNPDMAGGTVFGQSSPEDLL
jgi:putative DNA primase/helicase